MHNVLMMGWNRVVPGMESQAMELFQEGLTFWGKHLADGNIEHFEPILLTPHGGDLNGFFLIKGTTNNLQTIRNSEEFAHLSLRMNIACMGYGGVAGYHGEAVTEMMKRWGQLI